MIPECYNFVWLKGPGFEISGRACRNYDDALEVAKDLSKKHKKTIYITRDVASVTHDPSLEFNIEEM